MAQFEGCGGSMVVHQTVKPAVPGSNPASLQPAGTCQSLLGSQQGWYDNCRLASEGRQRQKIQKYQKIIGEKKKCSDLNPRSIGLPDAEPKVSIQRVKSVDENGWVYLIYAVGNVAVQYMKTSNSNRGFICMGTSKSRYLELYR